MKRFFALLMTCLMLISAACAEDYTVAEKLYKQLWAGSGFSGTLSVEIDSAAFKTARPITADADYIYVRETEADAAAHRLDLTLMDGENATSAAYAQLKDGAVSFQADVLSPDWFTLALDSQTKSAEAAVQSALESTGAPALAGLMTSAASALRGNAELTKALDSYLTRIDVWIEGYRQDAVLSKLEDDTTVMQVNYLLTPAAIKAQVKQLIVDLLNDDTVLPLLAEALGEEISEKYLNPALQSWYFEAVDSLPFPGDLTLSRTLAMTGETVELHLSLPLYDAQTGVITLTYDRTRGTGDLPEENTVRMESAEQVISLTWQEYSSMTGVRVMQGTLAIQPAQDFAVSETEGLTAIAFTLRQSISETLDAEGRDVYACDYALQLTPAEGSTLTFAETEIALTARFVSKQLKSAATQVTAELSVLSGETAVKLGFTGASRKKWTPEVIPQGIVLDSLEQSDLTNLLPGAALRGMAVLAPFMETAAEE